MPTRSASLARASAHEIEAEGTRLMNEAQNMLTPEARLSAMRMRLIDKLEGIIRESVKPMERIEGIKILQVDGLGGGGGGRGDGATAAAGKLRRQRGQLGAALPRAGAAGRPAAARDRARGAATSARLARGLLDRGQSAARRAAADRAEWAPMPS